MKKVLKLLVILFVFVLNSSITDASTIRETVDKNDSYATIENGTTIIGITKFESDVIITAARSSIATYNDVMFNYGKENYKGVKIYYYLLGKWYEIDEDNNVAVLDSDDASEKAIIDSLNSRDIYYVNNVEKKISIAYDFNGGNTYELAFKSSDEERANEIVYTDGKILAPATLSGFDVYAKNKDTEELTMYQTLSKDLEGNSYTPGGVSSDIKCSVSSISYTSENSCEDGTEVVIEDPTAECLLVNSKLKQEHEVYRNNYCTISCRDKITQNMFNTATKLDDNFFTYGDDMATLDIERECVSTIDYDKWLEDYNRVNDRVRTLWNEYKEYEAIHLYADKDFRTESCSYEGGISDDCNCTCAEKDPETGACISQSCDTCSASPCDASAQIAIWEQIDYAETTEGGDTYIKTTPYLEDGRVSCHGNICNEISNCFGIDGNINKYAGNYASSKAAYEDAIKERDEMLEALKTCNLDARGAAVDRLIQYNARISVTYDDEYDKLVDTYVSPVAGMEIPNAKYCDGCDSVEEFVNGPAVDNVELWNCDGELTNAKCRIEDENVLSNKNAYIKFELTEIPIKQINMFEKDADGNILVKSDSDNEDILHEYAFPVKNINNFDSLVMKSNFKFQRPFANKIEKITYTCPVLAQE